MTILECQPIWIVGNSCCGKTTRLASLINEWVEKSSFLAKPLILTTNNDTKNTLMEILLSINSNSYQTKIRTPSGLMMEDVMFFYPLICQELNITSMIPLRLRPEAEQELATQLWQKSLTSELVGIFGNEYNCVRRILDIQQLAGVAKVSVNKIGDRLFQSDVISIGNKKSICDLIQKLIIIWRNWCLEKSLLNYGLIYELYGLYLLPNNDYQCYLKDNYSAIFADDVDDYPAIMSDVGEWFINEKKYGVFTYNETGKVRLGFNGDPEYLTKLSNYCNKEELVNNRINSLTNILEKPFLEIINNNNYHNNLPNNVIKKVTKLRGDMLKEIATTIIESINKKEIEADEIVIIAPGLDEIARYSLVSDLNDNDIEVKLLNEQRPLITSPLIRSILTLLTLLYEGNGRLIEKEMIVEMLVILSKENIDLIRAGLLTDYCYSPDIKCPHLLTVKSFPRWDRLTHQSLESYNLIRQWIDNNKEKINHGQNHILEIIDHILEDFFLNYADLNYSKLAIIREFRETIQHFWQIQQKLGNQDINDIINQFILLLRKGTITANPLPITTIPPLKAIEKKAITLTTTYHYRSFRSYHRWQFWLDVGSNYWSQSGELFASSIFLQSWQPQKDNISEELESENKRLTRIIKDLLARVTDKVFLCHSDLDINGKEQIGKLLILVNN